MYCRPQWGCSVILFLVCLFFLTFPVFAQEQNPSSTSPVEEKETTGEADFTEADKEAIGNFFRMSPQEIEALGKKLEEALNLYHDRKFGQALPIFKEIANQVETMDIMFWLGTSAIKVGETQLAIQKFKKMLEIDPKLHRVRLELAAAYFTMGKYNEVRRELETVKVAAPPEPVQRNIERLLAAIEERTRKVYWNIRLSEGFQWDDNVSGGPDQRELAVLGGTLTLDKESAKLRDEASITNLSGNILYDTKKWGLMWNTTADIYYKNYFEYSKFNFA
ncbi:MAG: tetratricopeptide repeat protein, partial [Desulfobacteraceae bacterium]|nr:tetratricopeptide repeat protein [Desulfobacteraceae bacterium]